MKKYALLFVSGTYDGYEDPFPTYDALVFTTDIDFEKDLTLIEKEDFIYYLLKRAGIDDDQAGLTAAADWYRVIDCDQIDIKQFKFKKGVNHE